jgi:hypothetical protein
MARPSVQTMTSWAAEARSAALDAYIARRAAQGFRVETRSGNQAVIVRRHRLYFLLHRIARGSAEQRFVISVDQHGEVDVLAAEPVRW